MNFKKTALATAIGATLAISGVAQADGHKTSFYGRINNAIDMTDIDNVSGVKDTDSVQMTDVSSRFGFKGSAPINGDWTAFGRYEFSTETDSEGTGVNDTRLAYVGVTGEGFGTIQAGNMWSTFYNMVGTHLDPTVTLGYYLYSSTNAADLPYRVSNAIQYSNDFGPVSVSAEIRLAEDGADDANAEKIGESDGTAIGINFTPVEGLLLGLAVDNQDGIGTAADEDRLGFAAKYNMGMFWGSVSYGETEFDKLGTVSQTQLHVGGNFGDGLSAFIGLGSIDIDPDSGSFNGDEPEATTLNVTKVFGKSGFRVFWEYIDLSETADTFGFEGKTVHKFGSRIDF